MPAYRQSGTPGMPAWHRPKPQGTRTRTGVLSLRNYRPHRQGEVARDEETRALGHRGIHKVVPQPKKGHREGSHNKRKTRPTAQPVRSLTNSLLLLRSSPLPPRCPRRRQLLRLPLRDEGGAGLRALLAFAVSWPFLRRWVLPPPLCPRLCAGRGASWWAMSCWRDVSHASSCAGVGAWCAEGSCTIVASSVRICAGGRWVEIGPMRCGGKGRRLTLFDEENELLGHQDEGQTEEHVLLRETRERAGEHAADAAESRDVCRRYRTMA
ncbi:hypothetical protein BC826DRAFT_737077 [Russula brevipes]|nr:hypothetical protein BC826DRAFT_737077 [Russula brevipes]